MFADISIWSTEYNIQHLLQGIPLNSLCYTLCTLLITNKHIMSSNLAVTYLQCGNS